MTVVPPIFFIGLIICVGFLVTSFVPAFLLLWLGKSYQLFRINNPFRAIYLTATIAFIVRVIIIIPQIPFITKNFGFRGFIPPYLLCFFIVGFIVFSKRVECEAYGKNEAIVACVISLACVFWYFLVELALYAYIVKT